MAEKLGSDLGFKLSVGVPLLTVAAGAWYLSFYSMQTSSMAMGTSMVTVPIATMANVFGSPNFGVISVFLVVWLVGMVAMMFPAMIPVMTFYSRIMTPGEARARLSRMVGPPIFLGGYLLTYALLGILLFAGVYAAFQLGSALPWMAPYSVDGVAIVLLVTGVWQLTPLKDKCLSKCISPLGFFMTHAKKGLSGAFRMGAENGFYCVGCCWLYMLVMLAVAAMSLVAMVFLTVLIVVEKAFLGKTAWFKWLSAGIFIGLALIVVAFPSYLTLL